MDPTTNGRGARCFSNGGMVKKTKFIGLSKKIKITFPAGTKTAAGDRVVGRKVRVQYQRTRKLERRELRFRLVRLLVDRPPVAERVR